MPTNADELAAREHLSSLGFDELRYQPDGNVPPDILVDGKIAVEVCRLNQLFDTESGTKGLEDDRFRLRSIVHEVLQEFDIPTEGGSWIAWSRFRRPLPPWKQVRRGLRRNLEAFIRSGQRQKITITIADNLTLDLLPPAKPGDHFFVDGFCTDRDVNGFVIPKLEHSLRFSLRDKTAKVARFRSRY